MTDFQLVTPAFMARVLGCGEDELGPHTRRRIDDAALRLRRLEGAERDAALLSILKGLEGDWSRSGPHRLDAWIGGWAENLQAFRDGGYRDEALIPGYYRPEVQPMRMLGDLWLPEAPMSDARMAGILASWLGERYLADAAAIAEFGCGPGHNILALARMFPGKPIYGFDWAPPSQEILALIAAQLGFDVHGARFDMFAPPRLDLPEGHACLTIGAIEQLGDAYRPFLDYLLSLRSLRVVHAEPFYELHDPETLLGHLGRRYIEKRGYLRGYVDTLRRLESEGRIRIEACRPLMGGRFATGWNLVVWRTV